MNREVIARLGNELLDIIYPPGLYCIGCGKITDASRTYRLCNDCMSASNWITGRRCAKCGKPLSDNDTGPLCFSCTSTGSGRHPHSFDKGHACAGYGAVEQSVIFSFKYGGRSDIGGILGEILYDRMLSEYEPDELAAMYDMVIPVPIHREKKKKRGFNHAAVMAQSFAKKAGIRFEPDLLIRTKATKPMKGLGPEARQANIHGAFEIRSRLVDSLCCASILLIDDIFTTGATINEIATLLKHPYGEPNPEASPPELRKAADDGYVGKHFKRDESLTQPTRASSDRHSGAARVDFLAYAAAADYLIV